MFCASIYPLTLYGRPDGAFCSTANVTTVYFLPFTFRCDTDAGLVEASFRKPGGERRTSSFCANGLLALIVVVFGASACGASPPPPASCPSGSAGRERNEFCWPVNVFRSIYRE